jgi:hypothetical protein
LQVEKQLFICICHRLEAKPYYLLPSGLANSDRIPDQKGVAMVITINGVSEKQ